MCYCTYFLLFILGYLKCIPPAYIVLLYIYPTAMHTLLLQIYLYTINLMAIIINNAALQEMPHISAVMEYCTCA